MGLRERLHVRSRVARARRNAWARFSIESVVLVVAAVVFYFLTIYFGDSGVGAFAPIFEALVGAAVLTIVLEPFLRLRFAKTTGRELFWVLTNDKAPATFRQYVEKLMRTKVFYTCADWEIHMAWDDEERKIVKLEIQVMTTGVNHDPNGFSPSGIAYVLSSTPRRQSRYTLYYLVGSQSLDGGRVCNVNLHELSVPPIGDYVEANLPDGRIVLDESRIMRELSDGLQIGKDEVFHLTRGVVVFRRARGFFPMSGSTSVLTQSFRVSGPAATDMDLVLMEAASGKTCTVQPGVRETIDSGEHLPMMVLSWSPISARLPGVPPGIEALPSCDA